MIGLRYDWRSNAVLCLHNLSGEPFEIRIGTGVEAVPGRIPVDILSRKRSEAE